MGYVASENPVQGVEVPPMVRVRPHRSVTMEEIEQLTGAFNEPVKSIFLIGLSCGLRINEILALKLPDTDLENGEFHVLKNLRKKQTGRLKTEGSKRKQPIPAPLVEHLKQWLKVRPQGSDCLFPSQNGTPLSNRNLLRRHLHKACDNLGIPRIGWHDARHTFTSIGGEDRRVALTTLQALLGHSSPNTTLLYLHSMDETKREASNIIAQKLWPFVAQNAQNEQRTGA